MSLTQPGLFVLGLVLGSASHELGHLFCGWAMGVPIRICRIGIGPHVLRWRVSDTWLELCLLPLSGIVLTYPAVWTDKFRTLGLYVGGFVGNTVAFAMVAGLDSLGALRFLPPGSAMAMAFPQVLLVIGNLLPFRFRREGQRIGSDGLRILQLVLRPRHEQTALAQTYLAALRCYDAAADEPALRSAAAPRILWWQARPFRWTDRTGWDDEQAALEDLLAKRRPSRAEQLLALDILLTDALARGDADLLPALDAWSRRAVDLGPDVTPILASRGSVLVELGRRAEARRILEPIAVTEGGIDAFLSRLYLARAELAEGRFEAARGWVVCARAAVADPNGIPPPFLRRLEQMETELGVTAPG